MKMNPRIEDDVLMKVIEQTLRLDMAPSLRRGRGEPLRFKGIVP